MPEEKRFNVKIWIPIAIIVVIGTTTFFNRYRGSDAGLVTEVKRERSPVRTVVVRPEALAESMEHTGVLEASQDVTLIAEVPGKVQRVAKDLGDRCHKGETLLMLDAEMYRIALLQAEAVLEQARSQRAQTKRDMARTAALKEKAVVTHQDFERAQTALLAANAAAQQAEAAAQLARRNLRESTVRCPFSGVVATRMVGVGDTVGPQTPLARLVDLGELKLTLSVSATDLSRLRGGQSVALSDVSLPGREIRGKVARLGVAADPVTRTFPVEVVVTGEEGGLRPGQVVRSRIVVAEHQSALTVPEEALLARAPEPTVIVAAGGKAVPTKVAVGARFDGRVLVTKGLKAGQEVVIVGHDTLDSGDLVETIGRPKPSQDKDAKDGEGAAEQPEGAESAPTAKPAGASGPAPATP